MFLGVLFLFLIVADVSDASMLSNLRKLVGAAPKDDSATDVSVSRCFISFCLPICIWFYDAKL